MDFWHTQGWSLLAAPSHSFVVRIVILHSQPSPSPWILTLAEQLQAPPLLTNLQVEHLLQHLLPLSLLGQPHSLQFICVQSKQSSA